jgi:hypothetical protein
MAGISSRRWRVSDAAATAPTALAIPLVAVALAFALAGCGTGKNAGTDASPSTDTQIGGAPSGTASATPAGSATASVPASPLYPTTAKAYAQEFLKAWSKKDYSRLDQLGSVAAVQQVKDSVTYGGLPNANWHYIKCDGGGGTTHCTFRNDNGDETVIALNDSQIGHPTAVTEAPLDRTVYATTPGQYVNNFIGAWENDNRQRMLAYSTQAVVDWAVTKPPITSYTLGCNAAAGKTDVMIDGLGGDLGKSYGLEVDNALAGAGKKHAIVNHVTPAAAPPC